jgi:hypothetical protein
MVCTPVRQFTWVWILALGTCARAQAPDSRPVDLSNGTSQRQPVSAASNADGTGVRQATTTEADSGQSPLEPFCASLWRQEDSAGPINTDRPTFTPANTVVPPRRLQFESGFTFNNTLSNTTRSNLYDFPELAMRYGVCDRVEFRIFWQGQTYIQSQPRLGGPWRQGGGLSDMEVGFKWQVFAGDKERKWIPTTALITSVMAPTGGTSSLSSHTVDPYINLIYGWNITDKLTLAGSTGYLGMRQTDLGPGRKADSFERFHQSIVAFYSVADRTTLFYEWYVFTFTNAADNRPTHFMDGGVIHRLSANVQLDLRAGFGLSGRPDDFFSGAGLSVRF